jgi:hypothetical protein
MTAGMENTHDTISNAESDCTENGKGNDDELEDTVPEQMPAVRVIFVEAPLWRQYPTGSPQ